METVDGGGALVVYGWSDKGVTQIARIFLTRVPNEKERQDYWEKKMNMFVNVVIDIG